MDKYFYRPENGHGLAHNPFNSIIAPRPIGWISSQGIQAANLAPYSFFNAFNYTPPIIGFASIGAKDSLSNIESTGEFCWNLVNAELAEQMNTTSQSVANDIDEFELAGLKKSSGKVISVPYVAEAPVVFECKKTQIIQLKDQYAKSIESWLILGEVVGVHIDQDLLNEGVFDTVAANPVLRGGGAGDYFQISDESKFELFRPS
jgi:flavin reductase (DIM6/NTAB) family NADH-FMN oxidoreductase RutF